MQNSVTIILPVSRREFLSRVFTGLEMLDCDRKRTNLLVIVDGDDELFVDTRNYVSSSKFNEVLCVPYSGRGKKLDDLKERRYRIADIHNELKTFLSEKFASDFVLGIEDDTVIPKYTLKYLLEDYVEEPNAGFIEGVELGRWNKTYVGAWNADDIYEPTIIRSVMPRSSLDSTRGNKNYEPIDAGGLYCFMTRTELYKAHTFKVFENNGMGPDADFGLELRRLGYSNYIDWRINCEHLTFKDGVMGSINLANSKPIPVYFKKRKNRVWSFYSK